MERKFLDFSLPGSKCSTERKFHGSESSLYGLFAPGNESAEERKGQLPGSGPLFVDHKYGLVSVFKFSFFFRILHFGTSAHSHYTPGRLRTYGRQTFG